MSACRQVLTMQSPFLFSQEYLLIRDSEILAKINE